jgi:hypothetical protein
MAKNVSCTLIFRYKNRLTIRGSELIIIKKRVSCSVYGLGFPPRCPGKMQCIWLALSELILHDVASGAHNAPVIAACARNKGVVHLRCNIFEA